jgi:hypothetical protein
MIVGVMTPATVSHAERAPHWTDPAEQAALHALDAGPVMLVIAPAAIGAVGK